MEENLLKLTVVDPARFSISTLDEYDARLVAGWLESLRRWRIDEYARTRSTRLKGDQERYLFRSPTSDMMVAFAINGDEVVVKAILSKELYRQFHETPQGSSA